MRSFGGKLTSFCRRGTDKKKKKRGAKRKENKQTKQKKKQQSKKKTRNLVVGHGKCQEVLTEVEKF